MTYVGLSYSFGTLSDKFGRWRINAIGWAIYACVNTGFALLTRSQARALWPQMTFYGVCMALTDGIGKALIADHAPRESQGAAMGSFYALIGLTTLAASLLVGYLWDRSGAASAFIPGAAFSILALTTLSLLRGRLLNADSGSGQSA